MNTYMNCIDNAVGLKEFSESIRLTKFVCFSSLKKSQL